MWGTCCPHSSQGEPVLCSLQDPVTRRKNAAVNSRGQRQSMWHSSGSPGKPVLGGWGDREREREMQEAATEGSTRDASGLKSWDKQSRVSLPHASSISSEGPASLLLGAPQGPPVTPACASFCWSGILLFLKTKRSPQFGRCLEYVSTVTCISYFNTSSSVIQLLKLEELICPYSFSLYLWWKVLGFSPQDLKIQDTSSLRIWYFCLNYFTSMVVFHHGKVTVG